MQTLNPRWKYEKEIMTLKTKNKISYIQARKIVQSKTPISGKRYAYALKKTYVNAETQYESREPEIVINPPTENASP